MKYGYEKKSSQNGRALKRQRRILLENDVILAYQNYIFHKIEKVVVVYGETFTK